MNKIILRIAHACFRFLKAYYFIIFSTSVGLHTCEITRKGTAITTFYIAAELLLFLNYVVFPHTMLHMLSSYIKILIFSLYMSCQLVQIDVSYETRHEKTFNDVFCVPAILLGKCSFSCTPYIQVRSRFIFLHQP